jgi:hypothetical protein
MIGGNQSVYKIIRCSCRRLLRSRGSGVRSGSRCLFRHCRTGLSNGDKPTKFSIRVENITKPDVFTALNGANWLLAFSPGMAVVHTGKAPIFTSGKKDRGQGLEAQAEDGDPGMLAKSLESDKGTKSITVFHTPVGASGPGPITPAPRTRRLSLQCRATACP